MGLGLLGWVVFSLMSVLIIVSLEAEFVGGAIFAVLAGLSAFVVFEHGLSIPSFSDVVHWINQYSLTLAFYVLGYSAIGAGWSAAKWFFYIHNRDDEYTANKDSYLKEWDNIQKMVTEKGWTSSYTSFADFVQKKYKFPPDYKTMKSTIVIWIAYWPWSGFWTMINDPVRRLCHLIYKCLGGVYGAITKMVFSKHTELFNS